MIEFTEFIAVAVNERIGASVGVVRRNWMTSPLMLAQMAGHRALGKRGIPASVA
ncbi:hypothetical protein FHS61_002550 [Altererythrobacter atlanticus]|uniref:hypothetical protein n=1 Tax=Croceibacterium atlanticum TaxID=1267766 RepID=UPI0017ED4A3D|nr:hypothetical protein [Croceibacterium atlanticum]MBB5733515.1 hypothetical protein [Croceibacterium atlanticum]